MTGSAQWYWHCRKCSLELVLLFTSSMYACMHITDFQHLRVVYSAGLAVASRR